MTLDKFGWHEHLRGLCPVTLDFYSPTTSISLHLPSCSNTTFIAAHYTASFHTQTSVCYLILMHRFRIKNTIAPAFRPPQQIESRIPRLSARARRSAPALGNRVLVDRTPCAAKQVASKLFCSSAPMQSGQSTWLPAGAPEFAHIKAHSTCPEFVDEVWGFVVSVQKWVIWD